MAGRNRPSYLKRQKEQQRRARATKKREERRARKHAPRLTELEASLTGDAEPADGDMEVDEVRPGEESTQLE